MFVRCSSQVALDPSQPINRVGYIKGRLLIITNHVYFTHTSTHFSQPNWCLGKLVVEMIRQKYGTCATDVPTKFYLIFGRKEVSFFHFFQGCYNYNC